MIKILFISRAYPPVIGGIENQNYELSQWLPKSSITDTLANTRGKKFLPIFLPWALLRALFTMHKYDCLLLGDGVLAVVGFIVKVCYPHKTVVSNIHGLDLTFKNFLYQGLWVRIFLPCLDAYIAVSKETRAMAIRAGLADEKIKIIPNGVSEPQETGFARTDLEKLLGQSLGEKIVLLSAGRLVERKGVHWFLEAVFPKLSENVLYVVAGGGPEKSRIEHWLGKNPKLKKRVYIMGRVSEHDKEILLETADIFIQPNIPVENDVEGFGIAVLEAALRGRPVVAAHLEGLKDAITHEENGILVPPRDVPAWQSALARLFDSQSERESLGNRARTFTKDHYHWSIIVKMYTDYLSTLIYARH